MTTVDQDARRRIEYAILFVATFAAMELKRPFGLLAHQVLGPPSPHNGGVSWISIGEILQLAAVLVAFAVHRSTRLPAAPWLEKRLGMGEPARRGLWRPAFLMTLAIVVFTMAVSIAASQLGFTSKLGGQLHAPNLPQAVLVKLALLYPLAAIGAAVSEEMVYRFAAIALLVWLVSLARPKAAERGLLRFWLPIVLSGVYFGYIHVAENIETLNTGNMALDILIAPQTWAGIGFGYLFVTYGLEAAMVAHVSSDLLAPLALIGVRIAAQKLGLR